MAALFQNLMGLRGRGLLDGAAMIVCSLVEAYRFFVRKEYSRVLLIG